MIWCVQSLSSTMDDLCQLLWSGVVMQSLTIFILPCSCKFILMVSLGLKMWRISELISWYNLSWLVQRWISSERAYFLPTLWWKCFHQDLNFCPGHLYGYCYSHHHGHLANFGPDPASVAFTPYNYVLDPGKAMSVHTKYIDEALIR